MRINRRGLVAGVLSLVVLGLAPFAATALAQAPAKSLKDQLVGRWDLVAIGTGGADPYGAKPTGSMLIDADGHYSVIVITGGKARNISYYGTYTVDAAANTMTMHIDGSTRAKADGRDLKRQITFDGDEMVQDTPPSAGPRGFVKVTWKRVK
jgi:hypothetical protein